jgi:hypothetical protein
MVFMAEVILQRLNFNNVTGSSGTGITTVAKFYKGAIDATSSVAFGALECVQSAGSVIGSSWNKGLKGLGKEIPMTCVGANDLVKAKNEISKSSSTLIDNKGNARVMRRPVPERVGAAMGHVANAATKAAASSRALGGAMTYAIGQTRNIFGMHYSNDTYFAGAQMAATGINTATRAIAGPMLSLAGSVTPLVGRGLSSVVTNPTSIATVGIPMAGAGVLLYVAAVEVENANASTGKIGQIFHGTIAFAATVSAFAVPGLAHAVGIA